MSSVHDAIDSVQRAVAAVGKDSKTSQYEFRGVDAVRNTLHPLFGRYGLVVYERVVDWKVEIHPGYSKPTFMHTVVYDFHVVGPDGDQLSPPIRELACGIDQGGKGPGIALSYAWKNAMTTLFSLPTDDSSMDPENTPAPDDQPNADPKFIADVLARFGGLEPDAQTVIADWLTSYNPDHPPAMTAKDLGTVPGDIVRRLSGQINKAAQKEGQDPW